MQRLGLTITTESPVIVALDRADAASALALARALDPRHCRVKVGKELFTAAGPQVVEALQTLGFQVFLDLKFHDIPNTVAAALRTAATLGVWMVNVHAGGGRRMLEAARDALPQGGPLLIAVTVLTSLTAPELHELGISDSVDTQVDRLAALAADCGLDGVVCSAAEAPRLKAAHGQAFALVTPGIRPLGSAPDDQRRVLSPSQALAAGSTYLVIGRPVNAAPDPAGALRDILVELDCHT